MSADNLRIDRWLWCARFFKSRSLAAAEVRAGHVRLNGQRTKPAHEIKAGDILTVSKGFLDYELKVLAIPLRRGPAAEAAACYEETPESVIRREQRMAQRAAMAGIKPPTSGRPDKRTRRLLLDRQRGPLNRD
jgi:ribosome-associated heat shock protein Hsp15